MYIVKRDENNPILHPTKLRRFEALATLNGCPVSYKEDQYLIYRAMAPRDPLVTHDALISSIGIAKWSPASKSYEKSLKSVNCSVKLKIKNPYQIVRYLPYREERVCSKQSDDCCLCIQ